MHLLAWSHVTHTRTHARTHARTHKFWIWSQVWTMGALEAAPAPANKPLCRDRGQLCMPTPSRGILFSGSSGNHPFSLHVTLWRVPKRLVKRGPGARQIMDAFISPRETHNGDGEGLCPRSARNIPCQKCRRIHKNGRKKGIVVAGMIGIWLPRLSFAIPDPIQHLQNPDKHPLLPAHIHPYTPIQHHLLLGPVGTCASLL